MRIGNSFLNGLNLPVFAPAVRKAKSSERGPRKTEGASELARIVALAGQEEEVRDDLVDQARERWASGFYDSPATVALTAEAILREDF